MSGLQKFRLTRTHLMPFAISLLILLQVLVCLILMQLYTLHTRTTTWTTRPAVAVAAPAPAPAPPLKPKILCWILTFDSGQNRQRCEAVRRTWAKRCDKYLVVSNGSRLEEAPADQTLRLPIRHEGRDQLWRKVLMTNNYLYEHYLNQFDWFMKADDDTYVLVDSLRQFLANKTTAEAPGDHRRAPGMVYYGHRFKPYVRQGYMSGGSGYVLSREALRRLVEDGIQAGLAACSGGAVIGSEAPPEDLEIGRCLEAVGVEAGDTRDAHGKETFLPLSPEFLLTADAHQLADFWYFKYNYYHQTTGSQMDSHQDNRLGANCCSNQPISFHYIEPNLMYLIDWLLYDVKRNNND